MQTKLTLTQLRAAFWDAFPSFTCYYRFGKRQNSYNATVRSFWVDFVDATHRSGSITDSVANRATL